jgi:hypothetical protein
MSYRRFLDSGGRVWRVWEVVPQLDRRRAHRRVLATKVHHPERRVLPDRRLDMGRSRLFFPPTESAWLVFEAGEAAKRRLRPVPSGWYLEDDAGLERLCAAAEPQEGPDLRG